MQANPSTASLFSFYRPQSLSHHGYKALKLILIDLAESCGNLKSVPQAAAMAWNAETSFGKQEPP